MSKSDKKIIITNTQILIAALAAALASLLTYIATPMVSPVGAVASTGTLVTKCSVESFVVKAACGENGGYSVAEVVCGDGTKINLGNGKDCQTSTQWQTQANEACGQACNLRSEE